MVEKWFKDRYFMTFLGMMVIIVVTVMSSPILMTKQYESLLQRFNNLSAERETELQQQKIAILNNMSSVIVGNQKIIMTGQQNIQNNLSKVLNNISHVMNDMDVETDLVRNLTVQLANKTNQLVAEHNMTGAISGLGDPIIIPSQ